MKRISVEIADASFAPHIEHLVDEASKSVSDSDYVQFIKLPYFLPFMVNKPCRLRGWENDSLLNASTNRIVGIRRHHARHGIRVSRHPVAEIVSYNSL